MKTTFVTLLALAIAAIGFAQEVAVNTGKPLATAAFNWSESTFDFGKKKKGIPVSYEFRFTNTGMAPLIITSVKASCGCTVAAYSKDPVSKGQSGFVRATYDAAKAGKFSKTIAVYANTPEGVKQLTISGEIVE